MTISAPLNGSADMNFSLSSIGGCESAAKGPVPERGAHPSQLCRYGQQKLVNKMTRALQQTFRKLRVENKVRRRLVVEPGRLAFCIAAGGALRQSNRFIERPLAAQIGQEFRKPRGFH